MGLWFIQLFEIASIREITKSIFKWNLSKSFKK